MSDPVVTTAAATESSATPVTESTSTPTLVTSQSTPEAGKEVPPSAGTGDTVSTSENSESPKTTGVPEKYELKAPEGYDAPLEELTEFARELGLSNEAAQKLLEREAARSRSAQDAMVTKQQELHKEWAEQAKSDKEFGGKAFDKNIGLARKAVDRFASDALKQELEKTGFGNHPEVVRLFARVGKAFADDTFEMAGSQPGVGVKRSVEELFYSDSTGKSA